ncbi:methenyltetrahydrofolate cyclohydrolase [Legionella lansingensis]|uniref:Bifunctional protein FolD n=1 Tax=Legionella lansingensis TaxID=45067 RepID=A0A0W0VTN7_9GAMM|nr:bifunctional methylenetetrahydrofolate dehydrogenase/methenyltetrahydrofolate cyclohydrolase FolD [Legionella lansingensis]KTD23416.1 Bifunctional Methylenetetrahydrofolate dehydrogenase/Methenyltetrahydrofolate cyclohydrolase FolD [Legionella lansingensis]SNV49602.1 methenyltetrahydrofolate cyclohydrolase [Legionella lansingensis]
MTASLLDGKLVSAKLKLEIKLAVERMTAKGKRAPGLAVILVGNDPASSIYVNNKRKACSEVGFHSYAHDLPKSTTEKELLELIDQLNNSSDIDGILVQLPLPAGIDPNKIIECIHPSKDIDGFHPYNMGRLTLRNPSLRPCTPYGIINLLEYYQIPIWGKHTVVVGASNIVGRPMAMEFLLAAATVTVCHRFTENLEQYVHMADILVVATGIPDVIDINWLNSKQVIVDVGIHRLANGTLRGDIDFNKAKDKVAWITPVPGGVGPMTIAILLQNTLFANQFS